jgi:hypothetical protein
MDGGQRTGGTARDGGGARGAPRKPPGSARDEPWGGTYHPRHDRSTQLAGRGRGLRPGRVLHRRGPVQVGTRDGGRVDLFDRLPVPFGLVRGGVAPDHQNIKGVVKVYDKIAACPGFRFFGNVRVGRDVTVEDLAAHYHQIVYAFGCESDRSSACRAKTSPACIPRRSSSAGTTATPTIRPPLRPRARAASRSSATATWRWTSRASCWRRPTSWPLPTSPNTRSPCCARARCAKSCCSAAAARRRPRSRRRRSKRSPSCPTSTSSSRPPMRHVDPLSAAWLEKDGARSQQRNVEVPAGTRRATRRGLSGSKKLRCRFLVGPSELRGHAAWAASRAAHAAHGTRRRRRRHAAAEGDRPLRGPRDRPAVQGDRLPRHARARACRSTRRRASCRTSTAASSRRAGGPVRVGHYAVGWCKRGPTGLIGTNSLDAKATVESMKTDRAGGRTLQPAQADICRACRRAASTPCRGQDWQRLDAWELQQGQARGKLRHKLVDHRRDDAADPRAAAGQELSARAGAHGAALAGPRGRNRANRRIPSVDAEVRSTAVRRLPTRPRALLAANCAPRPRRRTRCAAASPSAATTRPAAAPGLWLGTASHVLLRLAEFPCRALGELQRKAAELPWSDWLRPQVPSRCAPRPAARASTTPALPRSASRTRSPRRSARRCRRRTPTTKSWRACTCASATTSARCRSTPRRTPLHRRGYRLDGRKAPLREDLAHALLLASGWTPADALLDPFCGSGTIAIEAAASRGLAPGRLRPPPLQHLALFDPDEWNELAARTARRARRWPAICGSDRDEGAITAARHNAERAGVADRDRRCARSACHGPAVAAPNAAPTAARVACWRPTRRSACASPRADGLRRSTRRSATGAARLGAGWRVALLAHDVRLARRSGLPLRAAFTTKHGGLTVTAMVGSTTAATTATTAVPPTSG